MKANQKGGRLSMKCHSKLFFVVLAAMAAIFYPILGNGFAAAGQQKQAGQQKPAEPEQEPEYSEEEYNVYEAASKEPDLLKRGQMLIDFIQKYPKSKLMSYINSAYDALLFECSDGKKYAELEALADKWLKVYPKKKETIAYKATAAEKLGHDEICIQCMVELYDMQPSGSMAYDIAQKYGKMKNMAKFVEWSDKVYTYPEYAGEYMLRFDLVQKYTDSKNFAKASEYCQLTLKSMEAANISDPMAQEQAKKVRRACYHLMGVTQYESGKFPDAMKSFQSALKAERYGDAYYYIGLCQWKLSMVEEAIESFAKAETLGGESKSQAKDHLETLYKPLHNNTLVGIDKVYRRAKEALGMK
jgi:tetratricopeptide (TPR) repeat protein